MSAPAPIVLTLTLPEELWPALDADVARRLRAGLAELLEAWSLGGPVLVEWAQGASRAGVALEVDGRPCDFPESALPHALAYVRQDPLVPADADAVSAAMRGLAAREDPAEVAELLLLVCEAALLSEPALLVSDGARLAALEMGIKPDTLATLPSAGTMGDNDVEALIEEASPPAIEIIADRAYLRELTTEGRSDLFPYLREGLWTELGLPLPTFRFRVDGRLRPRGFRIRVQDLLTVPMIGLAPGTMLVNETVDRLRLLDDMGAAPTVNPATGQPASVTSARHADLLTEAGLTTWDPNDHLILTVAEAVRRRAGLLLTGVVAETVVEPFRAYAGLRPAAEAVVAPHVITRILRDLVAEGVTIRNPRRILEALVRYETDLSVRGSGSDRLADDRLTYVRSCLSDAIHRKVARTAGTVVVYLLDARLEARFETIDGSRRVAADDEHVLALRAALTEELRHLPPAATRPAILTQDHVRGAIRTALRPVFPALPVLGYGDLPGSANVQPVARLQEPADELKDGARDDRP